MSEGVGRRRGSERMGGDRTEIVGRLLGFYTHTETLSLTEKTR